MSNISSKAGVTASVMGMSTFNYTVHTTSLSPINVGSAPFVGETGKSADSNLKIAMNS